MKKLFFIVALFAASFTVDAQCIKFKYAGANLQNQTINPTGDSVYFTYNVTTYIEKIGAGKFEKTDNAKFVLPLPLKFTNYTELEAIKEDSAKAYILRTYPNIQ